MSRWGFVKDTHYNYNATMGSLTFANGSEIVFMDLAPMPSDPNYERLGSLEFTGGFIEEAAEVEQKAVEVVQSRLRYRLNEFCGLCHASGLNLGEVTARNDAGLPIEWMCKKCGKVSRGLIPKLLTTCNPHKGYLYIEFYKPWKNGTLAPDRAFIRALVTDNPHISPYYIESLHALRDKVLRARLLLGDWEYSDDDLSLFSFDALTDLFTNQGLEGEQYLTCDAARYGRDRAVIVRWEGLRAVEWVIYERSSMVTLETELLVMAQKYNIPMSRVLVDEDGVGGGIVDHLQCKGFVGNSAPIEKKKKHEIKKVEYKVNYQNLRSQCYYELADKVNDRLVAVKSENMTLKDQLVQELEPVKAMDVNKDTKLRIVPKDEIKMHIGRSPDLADTLMMRMYFELKPERHGATIYGGDVGIA